MRGAAILAGLVLAACLGPPAKAEFDVASVKPGDDMATLTGWYAFSGRSREFRLYPTNGDLKAVGKGQCISGVATSLAGVPPETLEGKKVVITGNLLAPNSPDIGATANDCGASAILVAMDISYADET